MVYEREMEGERRIREGRKEYRVDEKYKLKEEEEKE